MEKITRRDALSTISSAGAVAIVPTAAVAAIEAEPLVQQGAAEDFTARMIRVTGELSELLDLANESLGSDASIWVAMVYPKSRNEGFSLRQINAPGFLSVALRETIERHRAAQATFLTAVDENEAARTSATAAHVKATGDAEIEAFLDLLAYRSKSVAEARAKVDYIGPFNARGQCDGLEGVIESLLESHLPEGESLPEEYTAWAGVGGQS